MVEQRNFVCNIGPNNRVFVRERERERERACVCVMSICEALYRHVGGHASNT